MDLYKPIDLNELKEITKKMDSIKPKKDIYVNEDMHKQCIEVLGFWPHNLLINNFVPKNTAIVVDKERMEKMEKDLLRPNFLNYRP